MVFVLYLLNRRKKFKKEDKENNSCDNLDENADNFMPLDQDCSLKQTLTDNEESPKEADINVSYPIFLLQHNNTS